MIPIYIPSHKRAHMLKHDSNPLRHMSDVARKMVTYVVPDGEIDDYRFDLPMNINVVEVRVKGIAATRQWIGQYAASKGQDKFLMMDDDVKFFRRTNYDMTNLMPCTPAEIDDMLESVEFALQNGFGHVGVSAREGNNNFGLANQSSHEKDTRILRVYGFWTELFNACEHGRVEVMEDFDVALQLLRKGYHNANLFYWAQDQGGTQSVGGCSGYRTHEMQDRSARKLAELHPGLVTLREKKNKTGGEFGTRTEVTIQWKKAFGKDLESGSDNSTEREHSVVDGEAGDAGARPEGEVEERAGAGPSSAGNDDVHEAD